MRRASAFLVAIWLAASLLLPAWPLSLHAQLPECCRRAGHHKCALQSASTGEQGPTLAEHCPFDNLARPQAVMPRHSMPVPVQVGFGELFAHPAVKPQTQARLRISLSRSRQKRGPPLFLA